MALQATFSGDTMPDSTTTTNLTGRVTFDYSGNPCHTVKDQAANAATADPGNTKTITYDLPEPDDGEELLRGARRRALVL